MRLFLAIWLGVFALDSGGVMTALAPDGCVELPGGRGTDDSCPDACSRCVCCMRLAVAVSPALAASPVAAPAWTEWLVPVSPVSDASPRGILHVPKLAGV
jgi:hypothetical protein